MARPGLSARGAPLLTHPREGELVCLGRCWCCCCSSTLEAPPLLPIVGSSDAACTSAASPSAAGLPPAPPPASALARTALRDRIGLQPSATKELSGSCGTSAPPLLHCRTSCAPYRRTGLCGCGVTPWDTSLGPGPAAKAGPALSGPGGGDWEQRQTAAGPLPGAGSEQARAMPSSTSRVGVPLREAVVGATPLAAVRAAAARAAQEGEGG